MLSERKEGRLPSNTEKNPREHVNAIALRSGNTIDEAQEDDKEAESANLQKEIEGSTPKLNLHEIKLPIPYPRRVLKAKLDKQFEKFLEVFKKLHINLPLLDVLSQMPKYAKFLKEVMSNERKWEDCEMVKLNKECSAIRQNKLPPKLKDPGSFSIPCTKGNAEFDKALYDLGASINLMPYSIFKRLGLHELTSTTITLQLADRSIKYPRGIVEDVLVKVGNFIIPTDFIVLDMEEDRSMPLILGRPFLATGNALIDVQKGQLTLRINVEEMIFNVFQTLKYPNTKEHEIYVMEDEVEEAMNYLEAGQEMSLGGKACEDAQATHTSHRMEHRRHKGDPPV
ncbi:PREDICTED: uncharacterized protein LOC104591089, partial [Nelumbo nucifera]|uniref:Uncharacterized protein LOC104591089 n=1 Tax=Nelumbo nucifera TaxID=4432 RepID=A0A1U7ZK29_NELNU